MQFKSLSGRVNIFTHVSAYGNDIWCFLLIVNLLSPIRILCFATLIVKALKIWQ